MQDASNGLQNEPIDVDDMFDGVEEVAPPRSDGQWRQGRTLHKRLTKRHPTSGSSSQQPIVLDSDDELSESIIVKENRRAGDFSTGADGSLG